MINLIKTRYRRGIIYLLISVLFWLSACGRENDVFDRMPELLSRNTNFEKVDYSGLYTIFNITNYKDRLYFTTQESGEGICEMKLGDAHTEKLFCAFSESEYGTVLTTDVYGNVYVVVLGKDENEKVNAMELWKLTPEGGIVFQTDFLSIIGGRSAMGIGADKDGYVYVRVMGINEASILVFNNRGEYSGEIDTDTKKYSLIDAIGRCADGYVYVALADKEIGEDEIWGGAIARLDGKNHLLTIQDISGIVSERGSFGCIGSTAISDFIIYGPTYDEIYLSNYNEGTSVADTKISSYAPNGLPMSRNIILDDGRMLSVKGWFGGYDENGDTIYKKEEIEFYYIPIEVK